MKVLLVLVALVVAVTAEHHGHCNSLSQLKVKEQWHRVYGTGHRRMDAGQVLWRAMFAHTPESVSLFERVHGDDITSPEFAAHSIRVVGALEMAIDLLGHDDVLEGALAHLKVQHDARHIKASYVNDFKHVLLTLVPAALGRCYDEEAWSACIDVILHGIFNV
jgi:hemoglobin-like flavoprotein